MKSYSLSSNLLLYLALLSSLSRLQNTSQKVPVVSVGASRQLLMKFYLLRLFSTEDQDAAEIFPVKTLGQLEQKLFQLWQINSSMVSSVGTPA